MDNQEAKQLFEKYLAGNCSPEERVLIKRAYNKEVPDDIREISEERYEEMKVNIWNKLELSDNYKLKKYRLWTKVAAAAIVLIISGIGFYFFSINKQTAENQATSVYVNDVPAGGNRAILTLASGKKINLSDTKSGIRIKASSLTYNDGTAIDHINTETVEMATVTTPRGGQYTIELPDGSIVALNAASTLKFPSSFTGLVNRRVELAGEGYFQVAKDKRHPFIVKSGGQEVEVLGTQFNINSYSDEPGIKTTLVEGSVKVSDLKSQAYNVLKPGQQSETANNRTEVRGTDVEAVTAWKNGDFVFNGDIRTIMRQIARWYDVEVVYQGQVSDEEFFATISRSKGLIEILKALELTKRIHFKIEGRRITVMP